MSSPFEIRHPFHSQGLAAGGSALLDAITKGKVRLTKFILDAGEFGAVHTRDFKGKTPLIRACYIKEEKTRGKIISMLLSKGADVNMQDDYGRTGLSYACEMRCNDIVRILVSNNVDPDICDEKGNTPLIYSALVGNDVAVEILIKSFRRLGLNVDHVNKAGFSALLIAAQNGYIECATTLALYGRANLTRRDPQTGMTAEEWARFHGCSPQETLPFCPTTTMLQCKYLRAEISGRSHQNYFDTSVTNFEDESYYDGQARGSQQADDICRPVKPGDNIGVDAQYNFEHYHTGDMTQSHNDVRLVSRQRQKRGSLPSLKFSMELSNSPQHTDTCKPTSNTNEKPTPTASPPPTMLPLVRLDSPLFSLRRSHKVVSGDRSSPLPVVHDSSTESLVTPRSSTQSSRSSSRRTTSNIDLKMDTNVVLRSYGDNP